ncbi:MAG: pyridoxamine 5'-phosphate oxidase family protein [Patescibacteria group bacterium]|jgi:nitroimidazol reductase NimA-like FMN-containing flavoprotein (pyridoxamine 5'-phosphate oxidase superfamily)
MTSAARRRQAKRTFLANHLMSIATCSKKGRPHAAVVLYAADQDLKFYFATKVRTRKARNLRENPRVAFVAGLEPPFSFQGEGRAILISAAAERQNALAKLAQAAANGVWKNFWPPILGLRAGEYAVYRLKPMRLRALDLQNAKISNRLSSFIELIEWRSRRS